VRQFACVGRGAALASFPQATTTVGFTRGLRACHHQSSWVTSSPASSA